MLEIKEFSELWSAWSSYKLKSIDFVATSTVKLNRVTLYCRKDHRFPPERLELLQQLSEKEDIYERLARAIAPSIYENEDIKKGILLQLFGGTKKTHTNAGRGNFR